MDEREWEENRSRNLAGASKGIPSNAKCVTKVLGDKNKEVGGTKFKFGQFHR